MYKRAISGGYVYLSTFDVEPLVAEMIRRSKSSHKLPQHPVTLRAERSSAELFMIPSLSTKWTLSCMTSLSIYLPSSLKIEITLHSSSLLRYQLLQVLETLEFFRKYSAALFVRLLLCSMPRMVEDYAESLHVALWYFQVDERRRRCSFCTGGFTIIFVLAGTCVTTVFISKSLWSCNIKPSCK